MMIKYIKRIILKIYRLPGGLWGKIFGVSEYLKKDAEYKKWVKETAFTAEQITAMKAEIQSFSYQPKISVVVPVYNIESKWLHCAVGSVLNQVYENWELCLVDDASPKKSVEKILRQYEAEDSRIKVKILEKNQGMSGSSNEGLGLATGEFVALLDHDDELSIDSLFEVVKLLNQHPQADLIFSDEDKLTMSGQRLRPVRKNGWDPELFLTYNYLCHLVVVRRELLIRAGMFRKGFEGSQDYDMLLRVTEHTKNIFHIPKILYHWRMIPGSAAAVVDVKSESFNRAKMALRDAMERRGIKGTVQDGGKIGTFRIVTALEDSK